MNQKNVKNFKETTMLQDEALDQVSGGGLGYNDFVNESIYHDCGINTAWTKSPFKEDKFYWAPPAERGKVVELNNNDASAVVYYVLSHVDPETGKGMQPRSLTEAMAFKMQKGRSEYRRFVEAYTA